VEIPPEERLPSSERFFAGGDTTVRGFTLDRLGDSDTISSSGFPLGGNGVVILNAELRVSVTGSIQAVGFVDGGNVYPQASDINVTEMRGAYGFGARYKSPVGPIRIDLGFKMNRLELVPGSLERGNVLHISLGQAF
jgi:outer membrane translocation and assembly module TamA